MKYRINEITEFMDEWAKPYYQESWDNSGRQINFNEETDSIIIALDLTDKAIEEAVKLNSKMIITHHPMFMTGLKSINENNYYGKNIIKAIDNRISVYSAHTSLDIAKNGVNDVISQVIELKDVKGLADADSGYTIGLVGVLETETDITEILNKFKEKTKYKDIKLYGSKKNKIKKIAICGGSGADFMDNAIKYKADLYITGDIKHHNAQYAYENNLMLMDLTHFHGEKLVMEEVEKRLKERFSDLKVKNFIENVFEIQI